MGGAGQTGGLQRGAGRMHAQVTVRTPDAEAVRLYAEKKVSKLQRHAHLHDLSLVVESTERRPGECRAELVAHMHHHVRLVARVEGGLAVDVIHAVVSRIDRQLLRRKERLADHKGHVGADGLPPATR